MTTYTAIYEQHGEWWVGQSPELPGAIVQERTLEEAQESMREVIPLILEAQAEADATQDPPPAVPHAA